jgi:hypothetical protein
MPAQSAPPHNRASELAQIEQFLAETGATLCPPAFAWGVGAALPITEEVRRIAMFTPAPRVSPAEAWRRIINSFRMARGAT